MEINSIIDIRALNISPDSKRNRILRDTGNDPCVGPIDTWCHFCLQRIVHRLTPKKNKKKAI